MAPSAGLPAVSAAPRAEAEEAWVCRQCCRRLVSVVAVWEALRSPPGSELGDVRSAQTRGHSEASRRPPITKAGQSQAALQPGLPRAMAEEKGRKGFPVRINIFGLGYVGSVSAACLAADGHEVLGIDIDQMKVDTINAGSSPVVEPGLPELIAHAVTSGRLRATVDRLENADISFVCVGTPSNDNGSLNLT